MPNQRFGVEITHICVISTFHSHYKLWVRFNTGEAKIFDFKPMLDMPAFAALKNTELFNRVYIDYGVPVWNDGDIDIAPEKIYRDGVPCDNQIGV